MSTYFLLQATNPLAPLHPTTQGPFTYVGTIEATSLENAFERSQHGLVLEGESPEKAWHERPGVTLLPGEAPRSTSVGDLLVTDGGDVYLVEPTCFSPVGEAQECTDGWAVHFHDGGRLRLPLP